MPWTPLRGQARGENRPPDLLRHHAHDRNATLREAGAILRARGRGEGRPKRVESAGKPLCPRVGGRCASSRPARRNPCPPLRQILFCREFPQGPGRRNPRPSAERGLRTRTANFCNCASSGPPDRLRYHDRCFHEIDFPAFARARGASRRRRTRIIPPQPSLRERPQGIGREFRPWTLILVRRCGALLARDRRRGALRRWRAGRAPRRRGRGRAERRKDRESRWRSTRPEGRRSRPPIRA